MIVRLAIPAFAAAFALLHSAATATASSYRAFSCDTADVIVGSRVFSAVPLPAIRSKGCPQGAGPRAPALGPCFSSPALVKSALDAMPHGARAVTLEAGPGSE